MTYRFLGTYAEIGNLRMERFGERVEMPQAEAEAAVRDRDAALLPDAAFQKLGITDAELLQHYAVGLHSLAPAEFIKKRDSAWSALHAYRAKLQTAATAAKE
jgi:hypothetical protein